MARPGVLVLRANAGAEYGLRPLQIRFTVRRYLSAFFPRRPWPDSGRLCRVALLGLGIERDLGELPIVDGDLVEEIFLISLSRSPYPLPASSAGRPDSERIGQIQNISGLPQGPVCLDLAG